MCSLIRQFSEARISGDFTCIFEALGGSLFVTMERWDFNRNPTQSVVVLVGDEFNRFVPIISTRTPNFFIDFPQPILSQPHVFILTLKK